MAQGNRGLAGLVGSGEGFPPEPRRPPKTGFLEARTTRLAELATGGVATRQHESVDPAVCRMWDGHNRDYAALSEHACADLIESLRAQGRQEMPAIVRRVHGDPVIRYEVVCGARRHWSVTWLRAHDYPDFKFVVEPRELTDEEAFRVADLENRSREDLSDYERASDYARAVDRYYGGSQQRMVERLQVSKSWLSRYLELARLPKEVLACFPTPHAVGISHAAALGPRLSSPKDRAAVLSIAATLAAERLDRAARGQPLRTAAQVVSLLLAVNRKVGAGASKRELVDARGELLATVEPKGRSGISFTVPRKRVQDGSAVAEAIASHLAGFAKHR